VVPEAAPPADGAAPPASASEIIPPGGQSPGT
jgi:hypothetical protein